MRKRLLACLRASKEDWDVGTMTSRAHQKETVEEKVAAREPLMGTCCLGMLRVY